jgi:hypothetical protein
MKIRLSRRAITLLVVGQILIDVGFIISLWNMTLLTNRMASAVEMLLKQAAGL